MKTPQQLKKEILAKVTEVIRRQHKSLATERAYCGWIGRYFDYCLTLPKAAPAEEKMERFLTMLAVEHDVSAATQNGAFHAIRYLYTDVMPRPLDVSKINALRATRPEQVRHAPTVEEVIALLKDVRDVAGYPSNFVTRLLYGAGLRVSEALNLRIKDVRLSRRELVLKCAKGRKDRVVRLPEALLPEMQRHIQAALIVHESDIRAGIPVTLPHQLSRKYPEYRFAQPWAFVFPLHRPCRHPRTGEIVRWRMMEDNVQKAIRESRRRLHIQCLPHELRHAYATHSMDGGVNMKALQEAMGHVSIETTAGYCHAEALSVPSPLDRLPGNVVAFEPGAGAALGGGTVGRRRTA